MDGFLGTTVDEAPVDLLTAGSVRGRARALGTSGSASALSDDQAPPVCHALILRLGGLHHHPTFSRLTRGRVASNSSSPNRFWTSDTARVLAVGQWVAIDGSGERVDLGFPRKNRFAANFIGAHWPRLCHFAPAASWRCRGRVMHDVLSIRITKRVWRAVVGEVCDYYNGIAT